MTYAELYSKLSYETAVVTFLKKSGEVRVMLATRNLHTVELKFGFLGGKLSGHDKRCNIQNGNVAVIDLILGEGRSFNIDRVLDVQFAGEILSEDKLDDVIKKYVEYKETYESKVKGTDIFNDISEDDKKGQINACVDDIFGTSAPLAM